MILEFDLLHNPCYLNVIINSEANQSVFFSICNYIWKILMLIFYKCKNTTSFAVVFCCFRNISNFYPGKLLTTPYFGYIMLNKKRRMVRYERSASFKFLYLLTAFYRAIFSAISRNSSGVNWSFRGENRRRFRSESGIKWICAWGTSSPKTTTATFLQAISRLILAQPFCENHHSAQHVVVEVEQIVYLLFGNDQRMALNQRIDVQECVNSGRLRPLCTRGSPLR